jgi:SRSO17 transposase
MAKLAEYERYMKYLCEALGHQDRHMGFSDYSLGLMLPIQSISVNSRATQCPLQPLH